MLILSRVCADFYDKNRKRLGRITRKDLGVFFDIPEDVKQDPLFQMLVDDKSILFPEDTATKKALENDPMAGADATGKAIKPKAAPKVAAKAKTEAKTEAKAENKAETKAVENSAAKPVDNSEVGK